MYIPSFNREERPEVLHEVIRRYSFATLVSRDAAGSIVASHLPFLFDASRNVLRSHMARVNPQWQAFERGGEEALVIFAGPHAYVSPAWYEATLAVPTWNYVTVHAYGTPQLVEGEATRAIVEETVRRYEAGRQRPWAMDLPAAYVDKLLRAIVGFEIPIARLEGKLKLSQNRSKADVDGVIVGLESDADTVAHDLAEWMRRVQK